MINIPQTKKWNILYRGSLSSCNYTCNYCPFAKTKNTREELTIDAKELNRFVNWVTHRPEDIGVLFTPWGEALIRKHYQKAMTTLSHLPNVNKVAIQTNLSCSTAWMSDVNKTSFALWTTYHPSQLSVKAFVDKCHELDELGINYSVGFVGFKEDFPVLEQLRALLNPNVYLWVNAYKREPNYYTEEDIQFIEHIDPLFRYNTKYHSSLGKTCKAGSLSFSVDGDGQMRSCHFIKQVIGNIYEPNFEQSLYTRKCVNTTCGCHIGYVHMDELDLYEIYGTGVLERIPKEKVWKHNLDKSLQVVPHHISS